MPTLMHKASQTEVQPGEILTDSQGEKYILKTILPPRHIASSGHVFVSLQADPEFIRMYYPQVFGLEFTK